MKTIKEALDDLDEEVNDPTDWAHPLSTQRWPVRDCDWDNDDNICAHCGYSNDDHAVDCRYNKEFDIDEADELDETTGKTEEDWFKSNDKEINDELATQGMRRANAEKGEPGWYVTVNVPGSDGRSTQKVWATDELNEDGPIGYEGHEVEEESLDESVSRCPNCGGTDMKISYRDGSKINTCLDCDWGETLQETFSFDRFMDNILLTENRCVQSQPDSPQRTLQARRQESPNGRTRFVR